MRHATRRPEHAAPVPPTEEIIEDHMGLERLVFFSDAVFAIAITLLALEIRLPAGIDLESNEQLLRALLDIWPKYLSYIISFLVIGWFWMMHHRLFRHVTRYDRRLMFFNLLLLMAIAFIPFPTSVVGESSNRVATIFYALTMVATGLLSILVWLYAHQDGRLLDQRLPPSMLRQEMARLLLVPAIFLLSIGVAYIDNDWARYTWILIALITSLRRLTLRRKA